MNKIAKNQRNIIRTSASRCQSMMPSFLTLRSLTIAQNIIGKTSIVKKQSKSKGKMTSNNDMEPGYSKKTNKI